MHRLRVKHVTFSTQLRIIDETHLFNREAYDDKHNALISSLVRRSLFFRLFTIKVDIIRLTLVRLTPSLQPVLSVRSSLLSGLPPKRTLGDSLAA